MKTITGFVLLRDCSGKQIPVAGRKIYAQPDQPSALFFNGTAWTPAYVDESLPAGFERAILCATDITGAFSFKLPQTSETLPMAGGPAVNWLITDPISNLTFRGQVFDALPLTDDVHDLVLNHGWTIVPSIQANIGSGSIRSGVATFVASSGLEVVIPLTPPLPNTNYSPIAANAMDDLDTTSYTAHIVPGWTVNSFTIHLSAIVEALRTVLVPWIIQS